VITLDYSLLTHNLDEFKRHSATISLLLRHPLFTEEQTKRVIDINNKLFEWKTPLNLTSKIHQLSGGNVHLIKYICKTIDIFGDDILNKPEKLITLEPLMLKLYVFIQSCLTLSLEHLKTLGIINEENKIFSPLVELSLKNYTLPSIDVLNLNLSKREKKILSMLYLNKGNTVSRETLDYLMNLNEDNYSLWGSYKAMDRLRKKVQKVFEIKTVRNEGYSLQTH
jgi:hypothetical protein